MEYTPAKIKDYFVEFLKTFKDARNELKYRMFVSQLPSRGGVSIIVDYPDLLSFNTEIATNLVKEPDLYLKAFDEAAVEALAIEDPVYSDKARKEIHVRLRELTDPISLRDVAKLQLNTLIMVRGMVVRSSELRPLAVIAAFRCTNGHITLVEQSGVVLKRPIKCETEGCGENKSFELDEVKTEFIDFQIIRIQELPEELPPGQLPQTFDVHLVGDVVNSARPGDRIVLTGIVKAESEFSAGAGKLRLFTYRIEGNFVVQLGKSPEETEITREEEEQIKTLAALPGAYDRLISSVAPAIYGHEIHKEAALLLMVGSKQKSLPDGSTLRGDINCLLVGDPGCLVSDERIVLGNGAIAKIGKLGTHHLEEVNVELQTGNGLERATGTIFHKYLNQEIIEILTESGKSLKGTLNHPVLARKRTRGSIGNEWRRLDDMEVGDRVAVTTRIPCTIKELTLTNFKRHTDPDNHGSELNYKLPELMTTDLAAFCGYMTGVGRVRKSRGETSFFVSDVDKDILPKLQSISMKLFGIEPMVSERGPRGKGVLSQFATLYSKDLSHNMTFLNEKRIPDAVLKSRNEVSAAYLRWLFEAVGLVSLFRKGSGVISLENNEVELLRDVQVLLLRFGIHSSIVPQRLEIRRSDSVLAYSRKIGFASKRKRASLAILAKLSAASKKRAPVEQMLERVVRIARHPTEQVYDIEVPGAHRFITNGIISHNTAKSELLKYVSRVAPRALYTSGRGTTAAGLTAAVVREKNGMLMLEAGATVLADLGVAIIDEFDKMRKEDRDALHEVMEQQSYHPSFVISLASGERLAIGPYVDDLLTKHPEHIIQGKDCEILPLNEGPEVQTCDIESGRISRVRVHRVSRHKAPERFVKISYANGRQVVVTPEHPIYVYRGRAITTISANEVNTQDYVPSPRQVPNSSEAVLLVKSVSTEPTRKINQPNTLTPELSKLLGFLISGGQSYVGNDYEITFSNRDPVLLTSVKQLFLDIFFQTPIVQVRGGVTIQRYKSKDLFVWFRENFPECFADARQKRCPPKILGASVKIIQEFLSSAFLVDGLVESTAIYYRTASRGFAEDYQDLLHKLGIISSIIQSSKDSFNLYIAVDSFHSFVEQVAEKFDKRFLRLKSFDLKSSQVMRGHDPLPPLIAIEIADLMTALGLHGSNYSHEDHGGFGVNRLVLQKYLSKIKSKIEKFKEFSSSESRNARQARMKLGISLAKLAAICGTKTGEIADLEKVGSGTDPGAMLRIRKKVAEYVKPLITELDRLNNLLQFNFVRVSEVRVVRNAGSLKSDWVYDLTVEPTHNFISKGVILHNTASVAKGGFIATLNARTSILAAANPVFGKYDPYKNILDNVNLPVPLLTRFDLVFIVKDEPDAARDEILAKHVLDMHAKLTFPRTPPIEFDILKKYIIYAKKLDPELTEEARKRLSDYYIELRRLAQPGQIAVTPRWLEGLIRLSSARARVLLHTRITEDDALRAVALMKRMLETVAIDQNTGGKQVDVGVLYGKPLSERNLLETALDTFKKLEGTGPSKQPVEDKGFMDELVKTGKFNAEEAEKMLKTLYRSGQIYEIRPHFYRRI